MRARPLELAAVEVGEPELGMSLGGVEGAELGERIGAAARDHFLENADGFVILPFIEETDSAMILIAGRTSYETVPE